MAKIRRITREEIRLATLLEGRLRQRYAAAASPAAKDDDEREVASLLEIAELLRLRGEALRKMA